MPSGVRYPQLQDREWLHRRYVANLMSPAAIADELGCSVAAVNYGLSKHKIPTRLRSEARAIPPTKARSCARCAQSFVPASRSTRYCSTECRGAGPPLRREGQYPSRFPQLQDERWLRAAYEAPRSGGSIAEELGCDTQLVYYWLAKHGISRRTNTTRTTAYSTKECSRCGTPFRPAAPAQRFCSERCQKQKPYRCGECGETFWSRIIGLRKSEQYYGTPMCSAVCRTEARRRWLTSRRSAHLDNSNLAGESPRETDGPIRRHKDKNGYVRIAVPRDYPGTNGRGWMPENRYVMEQALGRHLWPTETVHHVDNNQRDDNGIENLQLRQGPHGKGARFVCNDCGSHNISAVELT